MASTLKKVDTAAASAETPSNDAKTSSLVESGWTLIIRSMAENATRPHYAIYPPQSFVDCVHQATFDISVLTDHNVKYVDQIASIKEPDTKRELIAFDWPLCGIELRIEFVWK